MRLRNVPGSREMIDESPYSVSNPRELKGKWREAFGNSHPVRLEIGTGKGAFISQTAMENPDINFAGVEKFSSVLIRAIEKAENLALSNVLFVRMDAENITDIFAEGEIDRIYLNFSDPWPKDRHAKRRLTSVRYFQRYDQILKKDGIVEFKTDNLELFEFSLEQIALAGWTVGRYTYDLHNDPMGEGNIMTEYESKFSAKGHPICKLIARR